MKKLKITVCLALAGILTFGDFSPLYAAEMPAADPAGIVEEPNFVWEQDAIEPEMVEEVGELEPIPPEHIVINADTDTGTGNGNSNITTTLAYKTVEGFYVPIWIDRSFDLTFKAKKKKVVVTARVADSSGKVVYKKKMTFAKNKIENLWPCTDLEYTTPRWFLMMFPYTMSDLVQEGTTWRNDVYIPCYKNKKAAKKGKHKVAKVAKIYGSSNWSVKTYDKDDKLELPSNPDYGAKNW